MTIDPDNPVVLLCGRGVEAEMAGRIDEARAAYEQAWSTATDDYEACIAAHYLARVQRDHAERIRWNGVAIQRADAVGDERVRDFYPSLALNLGSAHEDASEPDAARVWYGRARASLDSLPAGPYRDAVERGISQRRTAHAGA